MSATSSLPLPVVLERIAEATAAGRLSAGAQANMRKWLTEARYADYAPAIVRHVEQQQWQELDDAFWTVIPFGTGGRRGRMYPVGCNVINDRTIGESAQGLADYVKSHAGDQPLACAIAYDTRHNSRHFAELCAGIMVAAGFRVYFLDDYRSTPELSFLVRHRHCSCGIMVTASHNPPSDNAVKVYWSTGGQILPPHDAAIIQGVTNVQDIACVPFSQAVQDGRVVVCTAETDAAFLAALETQRLPGPRDLQVLYSPLHGVGTSAVVPALAADGFTQVEVFGPHAQPDGDFPNVPGHVSNPENRAVFDAIIERARQSGADVILATDPDCDRMGCAAPVTSDKNGPWKTFSGNQLGVLLTDFVLEQRRRAGTLSPEHYVVKTLVTTEMIRRIADSYGVRTYGNLHVGFKWIGGQIDESGPDRFVLGLEESHGYLVGSYARDKDGAVACMLMAEMAAQVKSRWQTIHQKLDALYWQHGYHAENTVNLAMLGSEGMARMQAMMTQLRQQPPATLGGLPVIAVRDYGNLTVRDAAGNVTPLDAPRGDLVILDLLEPGNYVAVRPSGTEPKVKFYEFTYVPAEQLADLESAKQDMADRLARFESDLRAFADSIP
jgi:phosphoglucomutase/phosphomannomutase